MNARTPGPWVARKDPDAIGHDDWCIGLVGDDYPIDCVATCNARDAAFIEQACNNYERVCAERDGLIGDLRMALRLVKDASATRSLMAAHLSDALAKVGTA